MSDVATSNRLFETDRCGGIFAGPPQGKSFQEPYDVDALDTNDEWQDPCHGLCDDMGEMGLDVRHAWREVARA
jgi:hypothetical protein